ncbi:MAG: CfrBI family restriction endonuclease [Candidatus Methanospirare jalkutatii]|nr:MAG: CfrBI family restriction endonuclease [Candidatus Methanospirare jalkutatii]UYZ40797.1 MAG: CfrBI family restriction endonuclease [Candidatus Methanospirare jalkutatii]
MKELISKIIHSILTGQDYRTFVLATINKRFIDKVEELTAEIFEYKKRGDNWLEKLLEDTSRKKGKENKFKLLWYGGLNDKTVKNMTGGTSKKEVCLEIGKKNLESFRLLFSEIEGESPYKIKIIIKKDNEQVELDDLESILFVNIISAMKLTIQGGAWSEVGKQTEKSLLYVIFTILGIPEDDYILIFDEMKKKGLVENREIDAIVFNKDKEPITIELKLLGIGNPEIGDEALARKVDLFLIDRLTEMMIKESEKIGVKVIEFRQENPLKEIYKFFSSKNVNCSEPEDMTSEELKEKIEQIIKDWKETKEEYKILKKLKELTK